jgi:hypothetical protein
MMAGVAELRTDCCARRSGGAKMKSKRVAVAATRLFVAHLYR